MWEDLLSWSGAAEGIHSTVRGDNPLRIPFGTVTAAHSAIDVDRTREELAVHPLEGWVNRHIIARLPGSGRAGE